MRFRRNRKSSMTGMPSGTDLTAHTERTHSLCDASLDSEIFESHELPSPVRNEVAIALSNPQSPSRRSKEIKQEIRSRLGISGNITFADRRTVANSEGLRTRARNNISFWSSRFFLPIYLITLMSLLSRQWILLHGISLIIVWRIMERAWVWSLFILRSNEVRSILPHLRWISKFAFTQAEKTASGDRLRSYIATQTFNFWAGTGKNILVTFFRAQTSEIRNRLLKETGESLAQQVIARRKSQQTKRSVFQDSFRR